MNTGPRIKDPPIPSSSYAGGGREEDDWQTGGRRMSGEREGADPSRAAVGGSSAPPARSNGGGPSRDVSLYEELLLHYHQQEQYDEGNIGIDNVMMSEGQRSGEGSGIFSPTHMGFSNRGSPVDQAFLEMIPAFNDNGMSAHFSSTDDIRPLSRQQPQHEQQPRTGTYADRTPQRTTARMPPLTVTTSPPILLPRRSQSWNPHVTLDSMNREQDPVEYESSLFERYGASGGNDDFDFVPAPYDPPRAVFQHQPFQSTRMLRPSSPVASKPGISYVHEPAMRPNSVMYQAAYGPRAATRTSERPRTATATRTAVTSRGTNCTTPADEQERQQASQSLPVAVAVEIPMPVAVEIPMPVAVEIPMPVATGNPIKSSGTHRPTVSSQTEPRMKPPQQSIASSTSGIDDFTTEMSMDSSSGMMNKPTKFPTMGIPSDTMKKKPAKSPMGLLPNTMKKPAKGIIRSTSADSSRDLAMPMALHESMQVNTQPSNLGRFIAPLLGHKKKSGDKTTSIPINSNDGNAKGAASPRTGNMVRKGLFSKRGGKEPSTRVLDPTSLGKSSRAVAREVEYHKKEPPLRSTAITTQFIPEEAPSTVRRTSPVTSHINPETAQHAVRGPPALKSNPSPEAAEYSVRRTTTSLPTPEAPQYSLRETTPLTSKPGPEEVQFAASEKTPSHPKSDGAQYSVRTKIPSHSKPDGAQYTARGTTPFSNHVTPEAAHGTPPFESNPNPEALQNTTHDLTPFTTSPYPETAEYSTHRSGALPPLRESAVSAGETVSTTDSSLDDDLRLALELSKHDHRGAGMATSTHTNQNTASNENTIASPSSQSSFVQDAMAFARTDSALLHDMTEANSSGTTAKNRSHDELNRSSHAMGPLSGLVQDTHRTFSDMNNNDSKMKSLSTIGDLEMDMVPGVPTPPSSPTQLEFQSSFRRDAMSYAWKGDVNLPEIVASPPRNRLLSESGTNDNGFLDDMPEMPSIQSSSRQMEYIREDGEGSPTPQASVANSMPQSSREQDLADLMLALKLSAEETAGAGMASQSTNRWEDLLEFEVSQTWNHNATDFVAAGVMSTSATGLTKDSAFYPNEQRRILDQILEQKEQQELAMALKVSSEESQRINRTILPKEGSQRFSQTVDTEETSQRYARSVYGDEMPQRLARTVNPEETSQRYARTMNSEESSQRFNRASSSEEASQRYARTTNTEESSQRFNRAGSSEEASHRYARTMNPEESSQRFIRAGSSEESSQRYARTTNTEESSQRFARAAIPEEMSQRYARANETDEASQRFGRTVIPDETSSQRYARTINTDETSRRFARTVIPDDTSSQRYARTINTEETSQRFARSVIPEETSSQRYPRTMNTEETWQRFARTVPTEESSSQRFNRTRFPEETSQQRFAATSFPDEASQRFTRVASTGESSQRFSRSPTNNEEPSQRYGRILSWDEEEEDETSQRYGRSRFESDLDHVRHSSNSVVSFDSESRRQEVLQRGASEILQAIETGQTIWITCGGCGARLHAPVSYPLVLCPRCNRITAVPNTVNRYP